MSNPGMEGFKKQLEELKRKGADIDPDAIIADMTTPPAVHQVDEFKESFDAHAWGLMREKLINCWMILKIIMDQKAED
jgi:hypothetical protein